jgi:hypothetical protein
MSSMTCRPPLGPVTLMGEVVRGIRAADHAAAFRALGSRDAVF